MSRNDDGGVGVVMGLVGVAGLVVIFMAKRTLGVDFDTTIRLIFGLLIVGLAFGGAWWGAAKTGWPVPWQFLFPAIWFVLWPLIIAKGTISAGLSRFPGFEPEYAWYATAWFRWSILAMLTAIAVFLYRRASRG